MKTAETDTSSPQTVTAQAAPADTVTGAMRAPADWFLVIAVVCLAPLMAVHCWDLWARTDLQFFPILPVVSLVLVFWGASLGTHNERRRSLVSLVLFGLGASLGLAAAWAFSPWLAWLALMAIALGWMLERFGAIAWYHIAWFCVPACVLLLLPLSDATDVTPPLELWVASGSGILLDLLGVPQLVVNEVMTLRDGPISAARFCRGIASPYLLMSLVVLFSMLCKRTLSVTVLTLVTLPIWAWLGCVVHMTTAVYLQGVYDKNIMVGARGTLAALLVLILVLGCIWLLQISIRNLLLPFTAYSANSSGIHKFFNWLVLWPAKDPLRKRRSDSDEAKKELGSISGHRNAMIVLGLCGAVLLAAGGLGLGPLLGGEAGRRMHPLRVTPEAFQTTFVADVLPAELAGMRQVYSEASSNLNAAFAGRHSATWTYIQGLQRVVITLELSHRGFYPLEDSYLNPLSRFAGPRQSLSVQQAELGTVLVDEVVMLDDLYGRSFLTYATATVGDSVPFRTVYSGGGLGSEDLVNAFTLQPTVVNVGLFVEGTKRLSDEEKAAYRDVLLSVCELLKGPLEQCAAPAP